MKNNLYHIYPTMKCNLDCQHCFLFSEVRKDKTIMSVEDFKTTVDKIAKHYENDPSAEFADITIIGGEPTIVPPRYYEEVIPYIREVFEPIGKYFHISIVSNFTNTSGLKKIAHLFDMISTSYEYDRFEAQQIPTFQNKKSTWLRNLEEWTDREFPLGISISLTKNTAENVKAALDFLFSKGVRYFQFNYMHPDGELLKAISTEESYIAFTQQRKAHLTQQAPFKAVLREDQTAWGGFELEAEAMRNVLDWYLEKRRAGIDVNVYPITSHAKAVMHQTDDDGFLCPSQNALCVSTKGDVTGCTIESGQSDPIVYGNIFSDSLDKIMNSQDRIEHVGTLNNVSSTCYTCEYFHMCRGNCKFRNMLWDESPETECQGLKSYLQYLETHALEIIELSEVQKG